MDILEILSTAITRGASDVHLVANYPPAVRIVGELKPLTIYAPLTHNLIVTLIDQCINSAQKELLETNRELDFSFIYTNPSNEKTRFRVNAYYQKGTLSASFRVIPNKILTFSELNLPPILTKFINLREGFILLTGPSGQGKSTTIASMIEAINQNRNVHIVTIEDPIEYEFPKGKAILSQREMYQDTHSWRNALKAVLREDPDIVFIGEMRDYETISAALTIAETGHLVFSTLHTNSASQTIDRIIDIFPSESQDQVRMQLSLVISGVIAQRLVPTIVGGRVPVCEVLLGSDSVRSTIREGNTHMLDNIIQTSGEDGMMLFEEHLRQRVEANLVTHETALQYALRQDRYLRLVKN